MLLIFFYTKTEEIYPANFSKHKSYRQKQVILLMIPHGEGWYYIVVKKLLALLGEITSNHHGVFYCLSCLHSFRARNKLKFHKKVCENKDFCNMVVPSEDTKILEFIQY